MNYIIAIDGVAGSGKSTVSKLLSKKYNLFFISSGKYYRAITYLYNKNNFHEINEDFINLVNETNIKLDNDSIYLNGEDISNQITDEMISNNISLIANNEIIRNIVNQKIREFSKEKDIIMDGRDIGTVVFPNANLKIYITASSWERTKRRKKELLELNKKVNIFSIWNSIVKRDYKDKHRKIAPLIKSKDAIKISSTKMSIEEVVNEISKHIKR